MSLLLRDAVAGPLAEAQPVVTLGGQPVPAFQVSEALTQCKKNAPELSRRVCLDTYFVPRFLVSRATEKLTPEPATRYLQKEVLFRALVTKLTKDASEPSDAAVTDYLKSHERDFQKPVRLRLFRILVADRQEASDLLAKLSATTTPEEFRSLAREESIDKATNERGGDLGFVWPDGSTDVPQVSVDTALYKAAESLADGEFAREPVAEGKRFAVLWRRGSLGEQKIAEEARDLARVRLKERAVEKSVGDLLAGLVKAKVRGRDSILLGKLRRKEAGLFKEP